MLAKTTMTMNELRQTGGRRGGGRLDVVFFLADRVAAARDADQRENGRDSLFLREPGLLAERMDGAGAQRQIFNSN